jgi:hypothetical protein
MYIFNFSWLRRIKRFISLSNDWKQFSSRATPCYYRNLAALLSGAKKYVILGKQPNNAADEKVS